MMTPGPSQKPLHAWHLNKPPEPTPYQPLPRPPESAVRNQQTQPSGRHGPRRAGPADTPAGDNTPQTWPSALRPADPPPAPVALSSPCKVHSYREQPIPPKLVKPGGQTSSSNQASMRNCAQNCTGRNPGPGRRAGLRAGKQLFCHPLELFRSLLWKVPRRLAQAVRGPRPWDGGKIRLSYRARDYAGSDHAVSVCS